MSRSKRWCVRSSCLLPFWVLRTRTIVPNIRISQRQFGRFSSPQCICVKVQHSKTENRGMENKYWLVRSGAHSLVNSPNGPFSPYHAEFRGKRSSFAGPSVLGNSGQFLLRIIRCSNQIALRNASGDSLKRAITSAPVKRELSKSSSSQPVGQTSRACQDHAEYTTSTASRKRRAETLLRVDPFPNPHAPELRMMPHAALALDMRKALPGFRR